MNKKEFLQELRRSLRCYGTYEVEGIIRYYDEIISDNMDTGLSEYHAVAALGDVRNIADCIKAEMVETRMNVTTFRESRPVRGFFSLLEMCTTPLLIFIAVIFSIVYLSIFISIFAVGISIFAGGVGVLVMTVVNTIYAYAQLGTSGILLSVGVGVFAASLMCLLGVGFLRLSKVIIKGFTKVFARLIGNIKGKNVHYDYERKQGDTI